MNVFGSSEKIIEGFGHWNQIENTVTPGTFSQRIKAGSAFVTF
jgi:hypothetical protein